jgi:hypothetical protein
MVEDSLCRSRQMIGRDDATRIQGSWLSLVGHCMLLSKARNTRTLSWALGVWGLDGRLTLRRFSQVLGLVNYGVGQLVLNGLFLLSRVCAQAHTLCEPLTLWDTDALPSVCSTRQMPKYTRQSLCQVPHSAKPLPSATLGKDHTAKF